MKKEFPLITVIVTNYNGLKYLNRCFSSLLKQSYLFLQLVMADDGSTDGSVNFVRKKFPQVLIHANKKNSGLSVTSNMGAKLAKGKYLLFYNNDTISDRNFISEMVKIAELDNKIGVVCPAQLPYRKEDDKNMSEDQKNIGVGSDIYGYICTAKDAGAIFYPDAAIFIRADLSKKVGGFDNDFFLYGEDMDICWRVHLLGYKIVPAPKAKFRHDSFCALKKDGKIQTTYRRRLFVERQTICKLLKYYQISTLVWLLPKFFLFYFSEGLFFLIIKKNWRMFKDVYLKAIWWNAERFKSTMGKRKDIQTIRSVSDKEIMKLMYPKYRKLVAAQRLGVPEIK